jgi:hypothetical protein
MTRNRDATGEFNMQFLIRKAAIAAGLILLGILPVTAQAPQFKDTPFTVKLTSPLSTKTSQKGQEVTAQVVSPSEYQNWFMIGEVDKSASSGSMNKTSELRFSFHKLTNPNGSIQYPVVANVTSFTNSKGVQNADEEGQIVQKKNSAAKAALIGGAIGAGIGALAGGGKGAAIGAGAGAGAGLLFATFGVKGPTISFDTGSQFGLTVTSQGHNSQ